MHDEFVEEADLTGRYLQPRDINPEPDSGACLRSDCMAVRPEMLSLLDFGQEHIDGITKAVPGGAMNLQDIHPLSVLQEGILFHNLLGEHSDRYILSSLLELQYRTQVDALVVSVQKVIDRHDSLRSAILWENLPRPVQVVQRRVPLPVQELVLESDVDPKVELMQRVRERRHEVTLSEAPLVRLLIATDAERSRWFALLQIHHIVCDFQSWNIVIEEVMAIVQGYDRLLPTPASYRDYVRESLSSGQTRRSEVYFRSRFGDIAGPSVPFGVLDLRGDGDEIAEAQRVLEPSTVADIRTAVNREGWSAARLFHAAWGLVVARTSGSDEVVYGTMMLAEQRRRTSAPRMVGLFVNTLPLRLRLQGVTALELVRQTHEELGELQCHHNASLTLAQSCSATQGTTPLFTSLLNYRRTVAAPYQEKSAASGVRIVARSGVRTDYPIAISIDDSREALSLTAQTSPRISAERVLDYLQTAVRSLVTALREAPHTPSLALTVLPKSERVRVIEHFNSTSQTVGPGGIVHELIETQAERTRDAVAVVCADQHLTYDQLNRRANQLARLLLSRGVRPDDRVAVFAERSPELVVGLLGILKAGAAYVPLDVNYPSDRLRYMLKDCAPVVLLTSERLKKSLVNDNVSLLVIDATGGELSCQSDQNVDLVQLGIAPQHLAYVIYTSGSTGAPKGVMVEHGNLVNLIKWHCASFDIGGGHRCSSVAVLGFDAATWEIWPSLYAGATLVLAPANVSSDPETLVNWWSGQSLDVSFLPTPLAEYVFNENVDSPQLRALLVGGDRLRCRPKSESFALVNNYGPTEATVVATSGVVHSEDAVAHIGRPITNTQVYIVDAREDVVPIGVGGEIYIGGAGIARGYINRADLTAERFVSDPFSRDRYARLYRTGDLGRWREDGTIEYLGRNDHQVKNLGYRIELGEIESQLMSDRHVSDVVVTAQEDRSGEKRIVAYCTKTDIGHFDAEEIRARLREVLPEYMMPSAIVLLDRLPLTANGKIDRRALPKIELSVYLSGKYEPPRGELEERLAEIWKNTLQVARVGRNDDFFDLGGHSLLAIKSLVEVKRSLGATLRVTDIYKNPKLWELAAYITGSANEDSPVDLLREASLDVGIVRRPELPRTPADGVMLTGATGFVGRFLLTQLLQDTDATIYCFLRASSEREGVARIRATLTKWDLWREEFETRIVAVTGDLRLPRLGIDDRSYQSLAQNVDHIFHCATSMNHLETYAMAKSSNVYAAREILKLATHERAKVINYISTLGVFGAEISGATRVVNEESSIDDERHLASKGYVASKWVSEKIFMTAAARGIPCNIFRVGLVWADSEQGRYDQFQNVYRIFKSCFLTGIGIAGYQYPMPPTPVDYVARAIVNLANRRSVGGGVYHITSREDTCGGVFERCNEIAGTSLQLRSFYDWICEIKRLHQEGRVLPAVPLLEYAFSLDEQSFYKKYRSSQSTRVRVDCSKTHRELERAGIVAHPVNDDLLRQFVKSMFSRDEELRQLVQ